MLLRASSVFFIIMEKILAWDRHLFLKVNTEWTNGFLDVVMPLWRQNTTWFPLYVLIIVFLFYKFGWRVWPWIASVALMILVSDKFSSEVVKPTFARIRPCNEPTLQNMVRLLLEHCSHTFSFTSSHAVNHFSLAVFINITLAPILKKWAWLFYLWAFSIVYGQVYVGVHYPADVIAGSILGILIGWLFGALYLRFVGNPPLRRSKQALIID